MVDPLKFWRSLALVSTATALVLIPIPTKVVPDLTVVVRDQMGAPVPMALVLQEWDYRLAGASLVQVKEFADGRGVVRFPARRIRASALERVSAQVTEWVRPKPYAEAGPWGRVSVVRPGGWAERHTNDVTGSTVVLRLGNEPVTLH